MLIHGAWHGAWCWERVAALLRDRGHTVICPDLPGHGADPTPPAKVTMRSYTSAVEQVVESSEEPAVMVGHSLGGAVLSQVCEARPGSIRLAVYLCAFLLRDGESVWRRELPLQSEAPGTSVLSTPNLRVNERERSLDLDPAVIPNGFYNGCSSDDIADAVARWRPQPLAPLLAEVSLSERRFGSVPRAYISCEHDHVIPFPAQQH
ncbi:MAG TPA: alpha/beta fold hydrolase, partial [Actinomycetota bacterium]|nr:alpha/beta fold hydrolase [Actinomycetota bacterium]